MVNRWRKLLAHPGFPSSFPRGLTLGQQTHILAPGDNEGKLVRHVADRNSVRRLIAQGQTQQTRGSG
jgi:hypothetical protein